MYDEPITTRRVVTWDASTDSEPLEVREFRNLLISLPSGFQGTALTFKQQVGSSWVLLYNHDAALSIGCLASRVCFLPAQLAGCGPIRIVSDQTETVTDAAPAMLIAGS